MAPERAGLAGRARVDHRLPARLAARRQGRQQPGPERRIEEHGLHLWLGYYENAFRLLRECYAELDRPATDPEAPIQTWREAMIPAGTVGLEDRRADGWHHWLGQFSPNDLLPGEPDATGASSSSPTSCGAACS